MDEPASKRVFYVPGWVLQGVVILGIVLVGCVAGGLLVLLAQGLGTLAGRFL